MRLSFTVAVGPRQCSHSRSESRGRLMTIFYCLRFGTPPTWRVRSPYLYPPAAGWPSYTPGHWVPFSSPPTTRRTAVELLEPASIQASDLTLLTVLLITSRHRPHRKHRSSVAVSNCCRGNTLVCEAVASKQLLYIYSSRGRCPETGLCVTVFICTSLRNNGWRREDHKADTCYDGFEVVTAVTGARSSVVCWGTMLQAWRSRVLFPMRSLDFFQLT
jgi:hypothetical protein